MGADLIGLAVLPLSEGGLLDATVIGKLRSSKTSNPTRTTILGLCRFFQALASYFFPDVKPLLSAGTILMPDIDTSLLALGVPAHLHVHIRAVIAAFVNAERR